MQPYIQLFQNVRSYRVSVYAANAAYYFLLSLFPGLVLLLSLLPHAGFSEEDLMTAINSVVPSVLEPIVSFIVQDLSATTTAVVSASAIGAVWSSSRGVYCMEQGLNAICNTNETRGYWISRGLSMVYMLVTVLAFLATLAIHTFGLQVAVFCMKTEVPVLHLIAAILQYRSLIIFGILTVIFASMYLVLPSRRTRVSKILPGAAAAAFAWLVFSELFSLYVTRFSNYSKFYGRLSVIAIGMLWLYCCMSIIFYGQVLNELLHQRCP